MDFTIFERTGFEHIASGGPYVQLTDLPSWRIPDATFVQADSSWFALARDTREGLEMVQRHRNSITSLGGPTTNVVTYAILTLRQVTLCKAEANELVWTRSETLFGDLPASDAAIDMILWATNTTSTEPLSSPINCLPIETQDKILHYATVSFVASAKLGCDLGLGSPFSWKDRGVKISIEEFKRHRFESSPVESQIVFNGVMSGLSYKRERGYQAVHDKQTSISVRGLT
jgi:predicted NUDIX family NTP pyrophosphohydrolase